MNKQEKDNLKILRERLKREDEKIASMDKEDIKKFRNEVKELLKKYDGEIKQCPK